jgi:hypothetical protein
MMIFLQNSIEICISSDPKKTLAHKTHHERCAAGDGSTVFMDFAGGVYKLNLHTGATVGVENTLGNP